MKKLLLALATCFSVKAYSAAPPPIIWHSPYPQVLGAGLSLQGSDTSTTCNSNSVASIRYNSGTFEGCDGSAWSALSGGGGSVTNVTASAPLASSGGSTPNISLTGTISLTSQVSGTLPIANGGTNSSASLTNNKAIISLSGSIVESAVTDTELSYLTGTTSNIQGQLDGKLNTVQANDTSILFRDSTNTSDVGVLTITSGDLAKVINTKFNTAEVSVGSNAVSILTQNAGSFVSLFGSNIDLYPANNDTVAAKLRFWDGDFTNYFSITAPQTLSGSVTYVWPSVAGANGQVLSLSGTTDLVWTTPLSSPIDLTSQVSGVLPIANGGTNSSAALSNDRLMISFGGSIVEHAAIGAGFALISDASGLPVSGGATATELSYLSGVTSPIQAQLNAKLESPINLTSQVSGTLPIANGGTGITSFATNGVVYASGSGLSSESEFTYDASVNSLKICTNCTVSATPLNSLLLGANINNALAMSNTIVAGDGIVIPSGSAASNSIYVGQLITVGANGNGPGIYGGRSSTYNNDGRLMAMTTSSTVSGTVNSAVAGNTLSVQGGSASGIFGTTLVSNATSSIASSVWFGATNTLSGTLSRSVVGGNSLTYNANIVDSVYLGASINQGGFAVTRSIVDGINHSLSGTVSDSIIIGNGHHIGTNAVDISIFGNSNTANHSSVFLSGIGNISAATFQTLVGEYSNPDLNTQFEVGIGTASNATRTGFKVEKDGDIVIGGHLSSLQTSATTTATVNANAGTGGACTLATNSNDVVGQIQLSIGTTPASGQQCDLVFGNAYGTGNVYCVVTPASDDAGVNAVQYYFVGAGATGGSLYFNVAGTNGDTLNYNYHCMEAP